MHRFARSTRTVIVAAFAVGALFGVASTASATTDPISGDDRAKAKPGNVVEKDCPELFPGSQAIDKADLTFEVDATNTFIDVTAIADGVEVVGVIVKGGPAYNVYTADSLAELPWLDLHSPHVASGKPAQISHWFACGVKDTTTTTPPTSTDTTPPTTTEPPTSSPVTTTPTTASPQPGVPPAAGDDELADTGFNAGWLVALGAALLLGGGALLFMVRMRGARAKR